MSKIPPIFWHMKGFGIQYVIVNAIRVLYDNNYAQFLYHDGESEFFEILTSALQGDTHLRMLFIISLDHALRIATNIQKEENGFAISQRQNKQHSAATLTDKNFADSIVLISNAIQEGKMLFEGVKEEANYSPLN